MSEDNLQRPVNIILDVRVAVAQSCTNYQAALHGLIGKDKRELRKEWHVQVLAYYREISRYNSKDNIADMWKEPYDELHPDKAESRSLAGIWNEQFKNEIIQTEEYDNRNKTTKIVEQERMRTFEPEILMNITAKLDQCVIALGFDAAVKRKMGVDGYQGMKEEDEHTK